MSRLILLALTWALAWPCTAATLPATPATLGAQLAAAAGGDTVSVVGEGTASLADLAFAPAVTLNLRGATLTGTVLRDVSGLNVVGGVLKAKGAVTVKSAGALVYGPALACFNCQHVTFDGVTAIGPEVAVPGQVYVPPDGYGLQFTGGSDVRILNSTFTGFKVGVLMGGTDGFLIQHNAFERMRADGIDIAGWHGRVTDNYFMATRTLTGEHPDAVQLMSQTFQAPTAHIEIDHNFVMARSQGLDAFDHGAGGFDDISIHDNLVIVDAGQGIGEVAVRSGTTANNRIIGLPGSMVHTNLNTATSPAISRCGNIVEPSAGKRGLTDPPC